MKNHRNTRRRPVSIWPFVVIALLLMAGIGAVMAMRSANDSGSGSNDSKASAVAAATNHYPDLEVAQYIDPARGKGTRLLDYTGFTMAFNPANRTPDWVGWELLGTEVAGDEERSNDFWTDKEVEGCASYADYTKSGYDRGHMCPSADQKWSPEAMHDCFVMTNMVPQKHELNGVAWQTLENKERLWAQRDSALVIVAGPIYTDADTATIGSGVRVPSACFKVLLAPYVENPRAIGFVYPNMRAPGNMENYAMTVDEVEELTGLDFFSSLPDELENKIESSKSFKEWDR